jgi:N-acetylmuramoyl-L-alanine amidase
VRQYAWRQVAIAGLAFLLLGMTTRLVAANRISASVAADLQEARRWVAGTVIVVDPGHGGDDPGAVVGDTKEKHIVLAIGKMLEQMLAEQGAQVVLTREEDVDLGGRIREELGRRVALVEKHNANVYVSIHANKDGCNCWGAQTFYQKNGMPAGKELAAAIQNRLRAMTPTTRVPLAADYFVLRTSGVPAAMVEVGFLTHAKERGNLLEPAYQKTVATAIALGLADFFKQQVPQAKAEGSIGQ